MLIMIPPLKLYNELTLKCKMIDVVVLNFSQITHTSLKN
jgi:hypothetical protein